MKIAIIKRNNQIYPYANSDVITWNALKNNVVYTAEIDKPRNIQHHKLVFAEAKFVIFHCSKDSFWHNKEPYFLIKAIMRELGYVEPEYRLDGEMVFKVKSIAFENMAEDKFSELHQKMLPYFARIAGCEIDDILKNYEEFM